MRDLSSLNRRPVALIDPSELHRPEDAFNDYNQERRMKKDQHEFRNYEDNLQTDEVANTYRDMHTNQTVEFVTGKMKKWCDFSHAEMSIMDVVEMLDALVDTSDPDTDLPNSVHAFQTAERIREKHPDKDWFHLVGLLHDLGKIMALLGEPQYCVVGDTFPVGCRFQPSCVFYQFFKDNPDTKNELYNTKYGMYEPNCGLENVMMSWGHDEYMYRMLVANKSTLPEEGLYMIRYHSFYPWHTGKDYNYLCKEKDEQMLPWVLEFNKFDLYSKSDNVPDVKAIKPYYQSLIDKYCPGKLRW